jgi:murein DD-endopeptidase MepM/ murein hydrolase activator NlpD
VDPLREPALVVSGRVVSVCRPCAGKGIDDEASGRRARCYACGNDFDAWKGAAVVVGANVRMRCPGCRTQRASTLDDLQGQLETTPPPLASAPTPPARAWRWMAGGAALLAISLAGWVSPTPMKAVAAQVLPTTSDESDEIVDDRPWRQVPRETQKVTPLPGEELPPPEEKEAPFPRAPRFTPSDGVVHPLALGRLVVPNGPTGRFGANRPGDRPAECGEGHCGVDLRADEGTVVLAVRAGTVVTARSEDRGRGGRFVKIAHNDGSATYYFHLDRLRPDLVSGSRVEAGDPIATLGRTGVSFAPTHLHFAMTIRDDAGREIYVDPLPMVESAEVAPLVE